MKFAKIALCAMVMAELGSAYAADMEGDFNTWLGYLSGMNADGDRSTFMGAGAGGEATGIIRSDVMGAAAGAYATNLTDCIGMGYRALRGSSDMSEVVAIGVGAFTNRTGLTKATWINGQFAAFGQNNSFWIKANPNISDTNAPIHYANGVLSLNAGEVRINGETTGGTSGGGVSAPILAGYDLYVDPVSGDDSFAGTSPTTAKRTIDGALLAEGERIALLAGEHSVPTNVDASEQRRYYAPYGKAHTIVRGKTLDPWGFQVRYIENCTMIDLVADKNGYPSFCGHATNCTISTRTTGGVNSAFLYSTLEDCEVECLWDFATDQSDRPMFTTATVRNSTIFISSTNNYRVTLCYSSCAFENCYIVASNVSKFVYSGSTSLRGCTVLIPDNAGWGSLTAENCLLGCGEGDGVLNTGTNNLCAAYSEIAPRIGADRRPAVSDWRYYFYGYKSAADRAFRDAVKASIIEELIPPTTGF